MSMHYFNNQTVSTADLPEEYIYEPVQLVSHVEVQTVAYTV